MKRVQRRMRRIFKMSKVFVYPTETSYGIGCDARDGVAVEKVFTIKGRDLNKPVPLIAADKEMVSKYVDSRVLRTPVVAHTLEVYWPGPLTLVLPASAYAKKQLAFGIIAQDGTIAIRVPDHEIAREISRHIGAPIVATSANRSGEPACYSAASVRKIFKNAPVTPDVIIDEGRIPKRPASTIVRYVGGVWSILRQGAITL